MPGTIEHGGQIKTADRYIRYFDQQLQQLADVDNRQWQKTLIFAHIEALARGRFPDERQAGRRFYRLLEQCGWDDAERVSIPQLKEQLHLGAAASDELSAWIKQQGTASNISEDPKEIELCCAIKKQTGESLHDNDKRFIQLHRHDRLLYAYRSTLIHEARQGGYGMEDEDDQCPFYHTSNKLGEERVTIELVYPLNFLQTMFKIAIETLNEFYSRSGIDPFSRHPFGTLLQPIFRAGSKKQDQSRPGAQGEPTRAADL
jgi:hypothetical protein